MRKTFLAVIVAASLAGCTTTQVTDFIGQVQADAAIACKFVPTVATILAFFNAGVGATVGSVTAAICAAIPPPASARYLALPRYKTGGVPAIVGSVGQIPVIGWRTQ
jgi:hypothetical protein